MYAGAHCNGTRCKQKPVYLVLFALQFNGKPNSPRAMLCACMHECLYGYYCTIGEVIIWDLNKEDDMIVASSGIGDDSHREPVCKVQWIPDPESKGKKYHVSTVLRISI